MNKTDAKFKEIKVLIGKDLGVEVEKFLRENVEIIGMQVYREDNEKVAYISYVDREELLQLLHLFLLHFLKQRK